MPPDLINGLVPNITVEAQKVVETGFCSKFKTTHRHPSEKLMLSCKRGLGLKLPIDHVLNPSSPQIIKQLSLNQPEDAKQAEIQDDLS